MRDEADLVGPGKATFPAYGGGEGEEQEEAALIPTAGANTNIVHPAQDVSLVSPAAAAPQRRRQIALWQPPAPLWEQQRLLVGV